MALGLVGCSNPQPKTNPASSSTAASSLSVQSTGARPAATPASRTVAKSTEQPPLTVESEGTSYKLVGAKTLSVQQELRIQLELESADKRKLSVSIDLMRGPGHRYFAGRHVARGLGLSG